MTITISGTSGVTYPAGGVDNTAGAGVGTTDTQTLTNKTLSSSTITGATITSSTITSPTISGAVMSTMASSVITSGTSVSASGTSVTFTSIPSWVKRITVMFNGVSTNSTSNYLIQIGSGSVTTSGYTSVAATNGSVQAASTAGFILTAVQAAADAYYGHAIITLANTSNTYICSSTIAEYGTSRASVSGGAVTLSGAVDRVRVTSVTPDTFDAGSINIMYE